jgi:hypothetical protein
LLGVTVPKKTSVRERHAVTVKKDGVSHMGYCEIDGKLITVHYGGRRKTTQIGGSSPPSSLARIILKEMTG